MTDIVERLRDSAYPPAPSGLMLTAADEIERLRTALAAIAGHNPFIGGDAWKMRSTARAALEAKP